MTNINEQYVRGYLLKLGEEDIPQKHLMAMLNAMRKYGENRWWESDDPAVLAYHQLYEDILMIPLEKLYKGASKICGRPVFSHDLWMDRENLMKEIEAGMKRLKLGVRLGKEQTEGAVAQSIQRLEDRIKRNDGKVIKVDSASLEEGFEDGSGYDGWLNPRGDK